MTPPFFTDEEDYRERMESDAEGPARMLGIVFLIAAVCALVVCGLALYFWR